MNRIDDKKVKDLIHRIGLNNMLTDEQVKVIVEAQFRFTYETIKNLDFQGLTEEEISKLKTNFIYKHLGKLYTGVDVIKRYQLKEEHIKKIQNDRTNKSDTDGSDGHQ